MLSTDRRRLFSALISSTKSDAPPDDPIVRFINGPGHSAASIRNGETYQLRAGDVVVIPARTGHWFTRIDDHIDYLMIRVDPDKVTPLRGERESRDYLKNDTCARPAMCGVVWRHAGKEIGDRCKNPQTKNWKRPQSIAFIGALYRFFCDRCSSTTSIESILVLLLFK